MKKLFILIIWLCYVHCIQSQNYYNTYLDLSKKFESKNYTESKKTVDSLLTLASLKNQKLEISKICNDFSIISYSSSKFDDAVAYASEGIKQKKDLKQIDEDYVVLLFRLGAFFANTKKPLKAEECYKEVIELDIVPRRTGQAYCELALFYFDSDDFYKAKQYYEKGIEIFESNDLFDFLPRAYINLFTICSEINSNDSLKKAMSVLGKAERLKNNIDLNSYTLQSINNAYTVLYLKESLIDLNKAEYYAKENLELGEFEENNYFKCTSCINLAKINNYKKSDSVLYYTNKGLNYCKSSENISKLYIHKARFYDSELHVVEALETIQKGINLILNNSNSRNYNRDIALSELKLNKDKDHLLFMIYEKIKLLSKNKQYKLVLQHALTVDSLINIMQYNSINESKLYWREKASEIYTKAIEACHELKIPETAFYLTEKSKALLLTEGILINNSFEKLPNNIKLRVKSLKDKIAIDNTSLETKINYETVIDSISNAYPKYFKNRALQKIISLDSLQNNLDSNTIIATYMWPNEDNYSSQIYGLFIDKNSITLKALSTKGLITNTLESYSKLIKKPLNKKSEREDFVKVSNKLYNILLPISSIENKKIIISPDGLLNQIPFEALIPNTKLEKYLIEDTTISYTYSMSFLDYNSSISRNNDIDLLAMAPIEFEKLSLKTLENSLNEVELISKNLKAKIFTNDESTITAFNTNSKKSKIIHLATHAEAGKEPWIAFRNNKMNLKELYNSKNNADLTVLSSCNSSLGEIAAGEGVMSLARGFFYSGSNSVIASLWNVDDKSTSILMEDFYKNLKAGETKSDALQNAKLKYLKSTNLSEASPYYWSSFILLGNADKIEFSKNHSITIYIIIGVILLVTTLIFLKIKRK